MREPVPTNAKQLCQKGEHFLNFDEASAAVEMFQKAVQIAPSYGKAWVLLGEAHHRAGSLNEARNVLREAFTLVSDNLEVLRKLGIIECKLEQYHDAVKVLKKYLNLGGQDIEALMCLARAAFEIEDFRTVLQATSILVEIDEDLYEAWELRGMSQAKKARYNAAVMSLNLAIELHPDSIDAMNSIGDLCYNEQNYERALEFYRSSLAANWEQPSVLFRFATCLWFVGNWAAAIPLFEEYTELVPEDPRGWNNLGVVLREKGAVKRAIECYHRALELDPEFTTAKKNLETAQNKQVAI